MEDCRQCDWQVYDENDELICLAHFYEQRVFTCPYKDNNDRLSADYPCADYKEFQE